MIRMTLALAAAIVLLASSSLAALAADWVAVKARGGVFLHQGGAWVPLDRGGIVPERTVLRTGPTGRVVLMRDEERIDLSQNTQIRIDERSGTSKYTIVYQDLGEATYDVEHQNVQHFEVLTAELAAVVKGTRFTVTTDEGDGSVRVRRGTVQVTDMASRRVAFVQRGQVAEVDTDIETGTEFIVDGQVINVAGNSSNTSNAGGNGNGLALGLGNGGNGNGNSGGVSVGVGLGNGNGLALGLGNGNSGNGNGNSGNGNGNGGGVSISVNLF